MNVRSAVRRVAIVGASGQLGSALAAALAGREVVAPPHAEVDLADPAALAGLLDGARPEALVNCAAFHHVESCERDPGRALDLNALAVDRVAALCAERGIDFMTISTDYVFDGTLGRPYREADAPGPRTVYGVSKLAGELLARRHGPRHYIVRSAGIYSPGASSNKGLALIERVLRQAERGETTRMVSDIVFSPTYAPHAARALVDLLDARAYGTHHVTNAGAVSWYGFVRAAFDAAGLHDAPLEPVSALGSPVPRPAFSALANATFAPAGIAPLPAWEVGLAAFLAARRLRPAGARA